MEMFIGFVSIVTVVAQKLEHWRKRKKGKLHF